jgi:hypothetical protein
MGEYISVHRSFSLCSWHGCANAQSPLAKLGFAALKIGHTFKQINGSCWFTVAASCEISAGRTSPAALASRALYGPCHR